MHEFFMGCFILSLTAFYALERLQDYIKNRPEPPRRDFFPDLPASFDYERLAMSSVPDYVTFPVLRLDQGLVKWSKKYAENVPEHKTCFPEIKRAIIDYCSNPPPDLVSEFQYNVVAFRLYNCLYLRSSGVKEIDFAGIEETYVTYITQMTKPQWNSYQECYNVVRGLCVNEMQDQNNEKVEEAVDEINENGEIYITIARLVLKFRYLLARGYFKMNGPEIARKWQNVMEKYEKLWKNTIYHREKRLEIHQKHTSDVIMKESSYVKSLENVVQKLSKNIQKIDDQFYGEKDVTNSWEKFMSEYNGKMDLIVEKTSAIQDNLNNILKAKSKLKERQKQKQSNDTEKFSQFLVTIGSRIEMFLEKIRELRNVSFWQNVRSSFYSKVFGIFNNVREKVTTHFKAAFESISEFAGEMIRQICKMSFHDLVRTGVLVFAFFFINFVYFIIFFTPG